MKKLMTLIAIFGLTIFGQAMIQNLKADTSLHNEVETEIKINSSAQLTHALRLVETAPRAFDQLGELSAIRQLREANDYLRYYDNDFNIRNARMEIMDALRMLEDHYLPYREKGRRLIMHVDSISYQIRISNSYRRPLPPPGGRSFMLRCESLRDLPRYCNMGRSPAFRVVLARQHSSSSCIEGRSWGVDYSRNSIWVSRGCRATFQVFVR